jgi:hypothetical protein
MNFIAASPAVDKQYMNPGGHKKAVFAEDLQFSTCHLLQLSFQYRKLMKRAKTKRKTIRRTY